MKNNKNILDTLGILSIVAILYHFFNSLNRNTETNVISDDALKVIKDPNTANLLRDEVDHYHDTGEWNEKKLESIL